MKFSLVLIYDIGTKILLSAKSRSNDASKIGISSGKGVGSEIIHESNVAYISV